MINGRSALGVKIRRTAAAVSVAAALSLAIPAIAYAPAAAAPSRSAPSQTQGISRIVRDAMAADHFRAVIVRVTKGDKTIITQAFGTSMTGVPATTDMHFRNGNVAFAYMGTLLMKFVEQKKARLSDTAGKWMPGLPLSNKVTLKMLANQTSGYPDYETDPKFVAAFITNPFHKFTYQERYNIAFSRPQLYAPGTNWSYAHTNFMVLGKILAKIGKKSLNKLIKKEVLDPLGLKNTFASQTAAMKDPVLHSFSSERREALGIAPATPFYEEATFWNTAWGTPVGGNQHSDINDLATTAVAVGTGKLLSKKSYKAMTRPHLIGFGHADASCAPQCGQQTVAYNYGLGVIRSGDWILQSPKLSGYSAIEAYLPQKKIAIAVAVTFDQNAFDSQGNYPQASAQTLFQSIGAYIAPKYAPPAGR